ncbi:serine protease gd isoform X2 [Musca domestica]|uniref:Serine protease gd isoform X2 n=1 Tax=Musca domestica TaxID=7370 RepID=A0A9J7IDW6_MUSDO|nr:serine protease gd isoform X2 [Musca domestica]
MFRFVVILVVALNLINYTEQQFRFGFQPAQPPPLPPTGCPRYFQYVLYEGEYIGLLTIPLTASNMDLVVHLSQREGIDTGYFGRIYLTESSKANVNQIQPGEPVSYHIEFPSVTEIPKLSRIMVNGQDICVDTEYPQPSTRLYLKHHLRSNNVKIAMQPLYYQDPNGNFRSFRGNSNNRILQQPQSQIRQVPQVRQQVVQTPPVRQIPQQAPPQFGQVQQISPQTPAQQGIGQRFSQNPGLTQNVCGQDSSVTPFIYGGQQIAPGQFPWLTAIYVKSAGLRFLCGGSLLSTRTVLSAAHCFKLGGLTADRLVINVGRHNLEDYSEQNFQTREIQNLITHPEFTSTLFPDADLAVLHLQRPVEYTNFIRPICLWSEPVDSNLIVGQTGVVAGWGGDEHGESFTPIPKKVEANIVSDSDCLRSSQAYSTLTSKRTFCAGNRDGSGPCMGDSGSGLMINRNGRWFLRGVVSAGQTKQQKCNLLEYVVFCDVAQHLQWVQSNIVD